MFIGQDTTSSAAVPFPDPRVYNLTSAMAMLACLDVLYPAVCLGVMLPSLFLLCLLPLGVRVLVRVVFLYSGATECCNIASYARDSIASKLFNCAVHMLLLKGSESGLLARLQRVVILSDKRLSADDREKRGKRKPTTST